MRSESARWIIAIVVLASVALAGIALSLSAPHLSSSDELTYLTGVTQVKKGNLPDAYMLQGMDTGSYMYPYIALWGYEELGVESFKILYLFFLTMITGLAGYYAFQMLFLPWVPSLALSVMILMPRFSSGMEIFGAFTFKEAIGRSMALPLFLIGSAVLLRRIFANKSVWPVFALFGFFVFLHPVSVMLFAFVSLCSVGAVWLWHQKVPFFETLRRLFISGTVFVLGGMYFFVDVFTRLASGVVHEGVDTSEYVAAIVLRNAWEFPAGSLQWFPHMVIVTSFFLLTFLLYFVLPHMREMRMRYPCLFAKEIMTYGGVMAIAALIVTVLFPWLNLYAMQHVDAPYIFQQWSRISKFYYLGVFIFAVPVAYVLWQQYVHTVNRFRHGLLALVIAAGIACSSFGFEVAQFVVGYSNYTVSYIPQSLSGAADDITPEEYRETCEALKRLGASQYPKIVSNDFGLRYYCHADLFTSFEEGFAFQRLTRVDVVNWYRAILAQREALREGDIDTMAAFAQKVGADFIVVPRNEKYRLLEGEHQYEREVSEKRISIRVTDRE